ncbi:MAG: primosomal protein N' [Blastocatellia bacterium]|nr:primosomal protein N' [Blastocatellia bacterium]
MFAEIAIPLNVHQTFTYRLPESFAAEARPGCRALVPFGKQLLTGYIVDLHETLEEAGQTEAEYEVRDVEELLETEPLVTPEMLDLTRWIADYYYAPWGETIKSCLPAGINLEAETILTITDEGRRVLGTLSPKRAESAKYLSLALVAAEGPLNASALGKIFEKKRVPAIVRELERGGMVTLRREVQTPSVKPKLQQAVRLIERPAETPETPGKKEKPLTPQQCDVLERLREAGAPILVAQLTEAAGISLSVLRTLEKRGHLEIFMSEIRRDPLKQYADRREAELALTPKQQAALDQIAAKLQEEKYAAFLLHGVTGSGKTEVYIRAMRAALERGKSALMLVPEISLTPMFARRLRAHFGDAVAILHSSLSEGERLDEWNRLRAGEARVCIGARSAVFAPMENLGLIVVDEEHEGSYKQDESPRYHGRDTAIMRAHRAEAVIILGSATPSMESFHNAHTGKYTYIRMDERIGGRALAEVRIVDMRLEFEKYGKQQVFSDEMKTAIRENRERGEQTLVLLNRRGFSAFLLCRSCGHRAGCPNCDVALTYHRGEARLVCHYCNHQARIPRACPACEGAYIQYVGEGTEQIEALLREQNPELRISRLDRDTTRRRGAFEKLLGEFASGDIDLMVGTQMIAKGHDFHNVTLVCVISVDAGLGMPDFRAAERTFQLLTQVAGRAGRGEKPGRVLIQSFHTDHYALEFARLQDYERFYDHEVAFRRNMHYPPLVALINVLIRHADLAKATFTAAELVRQIKLADAEKALRVLGPAPAPLSRLRNEHRLQVLIKTRNRRQAREALDAAMDALNDAGHDLKMITIEVDPVNLM